MRKPPVTATPFTYRLARLSSTLQGVEPFILDLPARPPGAHQLDDVVGGGHQVGDPGIAIFHLAVLDDPELDEVDARESGLPFSGRSVTHSYSWRLPRWTVWWRSSRLPRRKPSTSW